MMRMKHEDHTFQRTESVEYSKHRRSSRYPLWKARRVRFCQTFARKLEDSNTYWFSGRTTLAY